MKLFAKYKAQRSYGRNHTKSLRLQSRLSKSESGQLAAPLCALGLVDFVSIVKSRFFHEPRCAVGCTPAPLRGLDCVGMFGESRFDVHRTEKENSPQAFRPAGCPVDCLGLTEVVTLVAPR